MNEYPIGTQVRLSAVFRQVSDSSLVNPDQVVFIISPYTTNPGSSGTFVYGTDAQVIRDSTGTYHMDFLPPARGQVYKYKAYSLGNIISSANDEEFWVR